MYIYIIFEGSILFLRFNLSERRGRGGQSDKSLYPLDKGGGDRMKDTRKSFVLGRRIRENERISYIHTRVPQLEHKVGQFAILMYFPARRAMYK